MAGVNQHLPRGTVGSVHGKSITSLKSLFDDIGLLADHIKNRIDDALSFEKFPLIVDFIQVQHLQLYILEQLCFGSRKFGLKTKYALSQLNGMGWGSEKASAIFSVERKTIPLVESVQSQTQACEVSWLHFVKVAKAYGFSVTNEYNYRGKPLPVLLKYNEEKRNVYVDKMSSSFFSKTLKEYGLSVFPVKSTKRVHLFKHMMASELLGKVPQVLLDEFLTHDRDGLDFCSPWGTGTALAMRELENAIENLLLQLNVKTLEWYC